MKLLLDANLSDRLAPRLAHAFPGTRHVKWLGMRVADDLEIFRYAAKEGFVIVTQDFDFVAHGVRFGIPPHIVLIISGNPRNDFVLSLLLEYRTQVEAMVAAGAPAVLQLPASPPPTPSSP